MTTKAYINGKILRWARERAGLSQEDLSLAIKKELEVIQQWESGTAYPTFLQGQALAKKLFIPFGFLFLPEPPEEETQIPDLRTVQNTRRTKLSLEFQDVLNDVLRKQTWYKEHLLAEGKAPLPFIGKYTVHDNPKIVAKDISETLGIDQEFRKTAANWEVFLSKLIEQAEKAGILILRNGVVGNNNRRKLSVQEFRGFVLSDAVAPIIFINNNDAQAAKIFTLVHELTHLWLGESGISNPNLSDINGATTLAIERFCNQVTAEVLVPEGVFQAQWEEDLNLKENLNKLARYFRVSPLVLLIRAKSQGKITPTQFQEHFQLLNKRKKNDGTGGGDFNKTLPVRHSKTFTREVLSSAFAGELLYREAAQLLGVKVQTLDRLATQLEIR